MLILFTTAYERIHGLILPEIYYLLLLYCYQTRCGSGELRKRTVRCRFLARSHATRSTERFGGLLPLAYAKSDT